MLRTARVAVLISGLGIAVVGLLAGMAGIGLALTLPTGERLTMLVASVSVFVLSLPLGSAMAWQAWQSMQGRPSRPFCPRRVLVAVALFAIAVVVGQWAAIRPPLDLILLPGAHVVATALPPLIIVGLVARSLAGAARGRHILLQLGSGAFLSTLVAMILEVLLIIGLVFAAAVVVAMQAGGEDLLQGLAQRFADPSFLQDSAQLAELARSPWVWATLLVVASGAIPLIEESVKTAGVGLMLYRKPAREEAYLWGLAGGAGFAMAESALNSVLGLSGWATAVLMRVPASLMHCFTGALMGLAWHAAFVRRRWLRGLGLFAVCLTLHGLWNALTVAMGLLSLDQPASSSLPFGGAQGGANTSLVLLLALATGVAIGLAALTHRLRLARVSPDAASGGTGPECDGAGLGPGEPRGARLELGAASGDHGQERRAETELP
jgi:hypothetical protein